MFEEIKNLLKPEDKKEVFRKIVERDSIDNWNIIRYDDGTGHPYDAILYNGVIVTTREDSPHIVDKLNELRDTYIKRLLNERD